MLELLQKLLGKPVPPDWDGTERRKTLRARCSVDVQLAAAGLDLAARVTEVGPTGLRIESRAGAPARLKPGAAVSVQAPGHSGSPVVGKIVWIRAKSPTGFSLAVRIDTRKPLDSTWAKPVLQEAVRSEPRQKRRFIRVRADWIVEGTYEGQELEMRVRDLSVTGARLESRDPLQVGRPVLLKMANMMVEAEVRQVSQRELNYLIGVRFQAHQPQAEQMLQLVRKLCQP
jgi:hypothetical protein